MSRLSKIAVLTSAYRTPDLLGQRLFYISTLLVFVLSLLHMVQSQATVLVVDLLGLSASAYALMLTFPFLNQANERATRAWEPYFPVVLGSLVAGVLAMQNFSFGMDEGSGVSAFASKQLFVVLALCSAFLVRPFGSVASLGFVMPVALAILLSSNFDALSLAVLAALVLMVAIPSASVPDQGPPPRARASEYSSSDSLSERPSSRHASPTSGSEDALLRQELEQLQAALQQKERDFEQQVADQTRSLRDANTQLSQQIALRKTISDALVKSQTRLTQAIDASHLGLIDWDLKAGQFYQSAFHKYFGEKEQNSEQVIETLKAVIHPDDYIGVRDTLNACLRGDQLEYDLQYRVKNTEPEPHDSRAPVRSANRDWMWIEECGKVVDQAEDGRADRILGTRRNIHSEVLRDEQVRLAKSVFDHTSEGVFVLDRDGVFQSANAAYAQIMGSSTEDLVGQNIKTLSDTPSREELYSKIFTDVLEQGRWQGELLEKQLHGDYFPQWTQINAIKNEAGQLKYYAGLVADISERKQADEKLDYLLNYDDLTKLANRVQFQDQLHRALVRFKDDARPFALVLLDIDRFKHFNDSFGHEASDQLLIAIADRLSASVQKVDILARVGSNEFACIVECSKTFEVSKFASRLFEVVTQEPYDIMDQKVVLACSVGVALVPNDTQDIETLMRYGALAVQKAKYHGGNQIQLFHESLKSFSKRRLEVEHELRKALSNDELEVYYQPKLDLKQGLITSYEALIRWVHPVHGIISPDEFVNIAEENGLINDLGALVLNRACAQTQRWMQQGYGKLHVSVNLSARQLKEEGFRALVAATIKESGLAPECLELELTESMIMGDRLATTQMLKELREQGIKVSVDDFGTGYSSLSYLKELPVDTLKIDRAFIDGMETSPEQQAIVDAIVVLGSNLSLQVVAEGVENDAQLALLQGFGCDLIQGYHISKPLEASAMERLLAEQSLS